MMLLHNVTKQTIQICITLNKTLQSLTKNIKIYKPQHNFFQQNLTQLYTTLTQLHKNTKLYKNIQNYTKTLQNYTKLTTLYTTKPN